MEEVIEKKAEEFFAATGRRKEAVCRVRLKPGKGEFTVNGKTVDAYLCRVSLINSVKLPLEIVDMVQKLDIIAEAKGGGISGQAGALQLALARALTRFDPEMRAPLKKEGLLTVDARKVERKKYGRPKARKRFQFSKR